MSLKESGEMYLETIYMLRQKRSAVRSVDIAEEMGYSRASISRGMGLLKRQELITVDAGGYIALTEKGELAAMRIAERHRVLAKMLASLGVDADVAAEDACRIEHVISDASFEAIKRHMSEKRRGE